MMKKSVFLLALLLVLGGCADIGLLRERPRDFTVTGSGSLPEQGNAKAEENWVSGTLSSPGEDAKAEGTEENFLYEGAFEYAARNLSEEELAWYRDIRGALGSFGESVRLDGAALAAGCGEADIDRIFQYVLGDHPELFYVEGYSYTKYTRGEKIAAIDFSGAYSMDPESAAARRREIEAAAARLLSGIDAEADQYTKTKYVYDTIIGQTDYDISAPDNQNIYSVFVNRRSVCQGYAKAAQYLLNRLGVDCTLVLGSVRSGDKQEGHAWNLVRVDGAYYYLDTTWGDASYSRQGDDRAGEETEGADRPEINYDYLNVTTKELFRSHIPGGNLPMPQCIATQANYYVREDALFVSYDEEQLQRVFDRAKEQNRRDAAIKCADPDVYLRMQEELVDNHEIFRYLGRTDAAIAYVKNDVQMSLTFWVTNE